MQRVVERILNLLAFLLTVGRPVSADEIRNTLRQLQNATDLLAAREAEVRARELELRDEQRRYEVGLSTTEILLRFQNDLASARISRLSSVVSDVQALISLDQATGTLLENHGIVIEPVDITVNP